MKFITLIYKKKYDNLGRQWRRKAYDKTAFVGDQNSQKTRNIKLCIKGC